MHELAPRMDSYRRLEIPHPVNIFHLDPPQMKFVEKSLGAKFTKDRYNIGFWHWELPEYPDYSLSNLEYVDEVWVPSEFVRQSIAENATRPCVHHAACDRRFDVPAGMTRAQFGLPADDFLFLVMYDLNSSQERKNPQAAIKAFRAAFPDPNGGEAGCENSAVPTKNPRGFSRVAGIARCDAPNIILINRMLSTTTNCAPLQNLLPIVSSRCIAPRATAWGLRNACISASP